MDSTGDAIMQDRYLTIYLRDHYAMAQGGIDFFERVCRQNQGNIIGSRLEEIVDELKEESRVLKRVLDLLHVERSPLKTVGARIAQQAGRLKLNGELLGYSPLSRLLELEGCMAAVTTRRGLWMTLSDARFVHSALDEIPINAFIARCDRQLEILENLHSKAARTMLKTAQDKERPGGRPSA
jgi:hypothetical protein